MIEISKVNKYFNRHKKNQIHVIDNISLKMEDTGLVALLGPSGSGKTTLLNVIGGLDKIQKGKIYINNKKISSKLPSKVDKIRNLSIGYIFQDYKLIENMSVYDNVAIVLKMIGIKNKEEIKKRVYYCLEKVGMYRYKNRPAAMLSGGERQRVGIARAIVKSPDIILADEPTGNLDSKNSLEVMNIIKAISKEKLVILVTHERELAEFYASRIVEIQDGKIVKDYENKHNSELDYRIENKFYLKDFKEHQKIETENTEVNVYSEDKQQINLNVVLKNGNIYIKTNQNEKIEVIDNNSGIEMVDEHYKKLSKEELEKYKFDFDKIIDKNVKKKYSSILNPITLVINGFKKVFDFSVLKKILLIGFFISSMFIMYAVSSICATLNVKDTDFIKHNSNYLQIKKPNMTLEEYLTLEQNENINYILPGSSLVSFKFNPREYYQTNDITLSVSGSLSSTDMISNENIISGVMPENEKQIILDKMIIQRQIDQEYGYFQMIGILKPEDMIGKQLTLDNIGDFTVVGIVDLSTPSIYVNPTMLINIVQNAHSSSEMEMIGGIYISDVEEPETVQILDYKLYEDKITLKKGRFPENDYEVIVNISHKYDMRLNKTISTMVNDKKLTVVGYYESQEGIDKYLVNNNTVKYKLIREKQEFMVYAKDKEKALNDFRNLNLNVVNTYENSKEEYLRAKKENMKTSIIVSAIILAISLIEIFLMIRSSFLSRIKEIGILRAIGIKKKDIYKMFAGETIAITTLASVPGIILMAYILKALSQITYFSRFFLVNIWTIIVTIILIYLFNLIIGLLPVHRVVKKTPAQILSRHDI